MKTGEQSENQIAFSPESSVLINADRSHPDNTNEQAMGRYFVGSISRFGIVLDNRQVARIFSLIKQLFNVIYRNKEGGHICLTHYNMASYLGQ